MLDAERQPPQTAESEAAHEPAVRLSARNDLPNGASLPPLPKLTCCSEDDDRAASSSGVVQSPLHKSSNAHDNGATLPVLTLPVMCSQRGDACTENSRLGGSISWVDTPTSTPTFGLRSPSTHQETEHAPIDNFAHLLGNIPDDEVVIPFRRGRVPGRKPMSPEALLRRVATYPNLQAPAVIEGEFPPGLPLLQGSVNPRLSPPGSSTGRRDASRAMSSHRIGSSPASTIPCGLSRATTQDLVEWSYTASMRSPWSSMDSSYQERRMRQRHAQILPGQQNLNDTGPFAIGSAEIAEVIHNLRYYNQLSSQKQNTAVKDFWLCRNWRLAIVVVTFSGMVLDLITLFAPAFHLQSSGIATQTDYMFHFHDEYPYYVIAGVLIITSFIPSLFTLINTLLGKCVKSIILGRFCALLPIIFRAVVLVLNRDLVTEMMSSPHHFHIPNGEGTVSEKVYFATLGLGMWANFGAMLLGVVDVIFFQFQESAELDEQRNDNFTEWWNELTV